jgi:hypothetical protein
MMTSEGHPWKLSKTPSHCLNLVSFCRHLKQAHMARGIHGLPKVSPRPALPNPSMTPGPATPKTALLPFQGLVCSQGGQPAALSYPFGHPTLYAYAGASLYFKPQCCPPLLPSTHRHPKPAPGTGTGNRVTKSQKKRSRKELVPRSRTPGSRRQQARTGWGIQGGRRRPQATRPAGGPPQKRLEGRLGGGPPAGHRRVGLGGPG